MKIRPKLSGAPLAYTLALVEGANVYNDFGAAVWSEDLTVDVKLKELLFVRTSIVNECPT